MNVRLATRRSPLALAQSNYVAQRLAHFGVSATLVPVETRGDRELHGDLTDLGGQGVFAVEVQACVLSGEADVAVHSAKDLPSVTPTGLRLVCVPQRLDPADVLVGRSLAGLGPGATVATGSPRRRALLLERRPDLHVVTLRGNMARRLAAAGRDGVDAVVAAAAALERLGESARVAERLDPTWFVPQVGQGALALEVRDDDDNELASHMRAIDDDGAHRALLAERAFLGELGVGCTAPAGANGSVVGEIVSLRGVLLTVDGSRSARGHVEDVDPLRAGANLARRLRDELGGQLSTETGRA